MYNYRVITLDLTNAGARRELVEPNVGIASVSVRQLTGALQLRYGGNGQPSSVGAQDAIAFPQLLTEGLYGEWIAQPGKVAELFVYLAPITR